MSYHLLRPMLTCLCVWWLLVTVLEPVKGLVGAFRVAEAFGFSLKIFMAWYVYRSELFCDSGHFGRDAGCQPWCKAQTGDMHFRVCEYYSCMHDPRILVDTIHDHSHSGYQLSHFQIIEWMRG